MYLHKETHMFHLNDSYLVIALISLIVVALAFGFYSGMTNATGKMKPLEKMKWFVPGEKYVCITSMNDPNNKTYPHICLVQKSGTNQIRVTCEKKELPQTFVNVNGKPTPLKT